MDWLDIVANIAIVWLSIQYGGWRQRHKDKLKYFWKCAEQNCGLELETSNEYGLGYVSRMHMQDAHGMRTLSDD